MTGGGRGYCNPTAGGYRSFYGRGFGRGFGRGRGFRRGSGPWSGWGGDYPGRGGFYGPVYGPTYARPYNASPEDELTMLRGEASAIKEDLDAINKRIEELEKGSSD
jgi:hypothetical protein